MRSIHDTINRFPAIFVSHGAPTLPLFVALGSATPGAPARRLHSRYLGGVISMDAYRYN